MSLLDRDSTPEDLEAKREAPRSGVWAGEPGADLRALTQDATDALIRAELVEAALPAERAAVLQGVGGEPVEIVVHVRPDAPQAELMGQRAINRQRGGIDSDPLVRVLARRTARRGRGAAVSALGSEHRVAREAGRHRELQHAREPHQGNEDGRRAPCAGASDAGRDAGRMAPVRVSRDDGARPQAHDLIVPLPSRRGRRAAIPEGGVVPQHRLQLQALAEEDLPMLGWRYREPYATKSTFITLACKDGANPAVIESRVTHTKKTRSAFDGYRRDSQWPETW